jgi:hypothetical protein
MNRDLPSGAAATQVGRTFRGRVLEALWWSVLVLVPAWLVARGSDDKAVVLGLGVAVAAVVFVAFVRRDATVVTAEEIRLRKRTIRRADVARVTAGTETTALVFRDADDRIITVADLMGQARTFREALRAHGWPPVEPEA